MQLWIWTNSTEPGAISGVTKIHKVAYFSSLMNRHSSRLKVIFKALSIVVWLLIPVHQINVPYLQKFISIKLVREPVSTFTHIIAQAIVNLISGAYCTYMLRSFYCISNVLRWYGTPVDMNVDKNPTIIKKIAPFLNFQTPQYFTKK